MTKCEFSLSGRFEIRALPLPINTPPYLKKKVSMHSVTREGIRKQNKQTKNEKKKKSLRHNIFKNLILSNELIKVELPP